MIEAIGLLGGGGTGINVTTEVGKVVDFEKRLAQVGHL
jgi:hypothetical protein